MCRFGFRVETGPLSRSEPDSEHLMTIKSKLKKSIFVVKNGLFSSKVTFFETLAAKQQDLFCDLRHIEGRLNVRLKAEKLYFLNLEKYFGFDPFL